MTKETTAAESQMGMAQIFHRFLIEKKWDLEFVLKNFPGGVELLDALLYQVCRVTEGACPKAASNLIRLLQSNGHLPKDQVMTAFEEGILIKFAEKELNEPQAILSMALFLTELFGEEKELSWLVKVGESLLEAEFKVILHNLTSSVLINLKAERTRAQFQHLFLTSTKGPERMALQTHMGPDFWKEFNEDLYEKPNFIPPRPVRSEFPAQEKFHVLKYFLEKTPPESRADSVNQIAVVSPRVKATAAAIAPSPESPPPIVHPIPLAPFHPLAVPPLPPNWEHSYRVALSDVSLFKRFPVGQGSAEYRVLASIVQPLLAISKINRVVNPELWRKFNNKRKEMLSNKSEDFQLLAALGLSDREVHYRAHLNWNFTRDHAIITGNEYSDTLCLLFHCTRATGKVNDILKEGLDERLSASGTLGRGIYFADDPAKAVSYDTNNTLLIFAVLLGDCVNVDGLQNPTGHVREPPKTLEQKRNHLDLFFDSIVGRPGGKNNEFVIFNRDQCCPLYEITYTKAGSMTFPRGISFLPLHSGINQLATVREKIPPFAWSTKKSPVILSGPSPPPRGEIIWPLLASTIFQQMRPDELIVLNLNMSMASACRSLAVGPEGQGENEECRICRTDFEVSPDSWNMLNCGHKLCKFCYVRIRSEGTTMSGVHHTFLRCPYCQDSTGLEIGTCLDGTMDVSEIQCSAEGYEGHPTFKITYRVTGPIALHRIAYVPKTEEGKKVVELLRRVWDRRLCFSVGTSMTTGRSNVLVWNIHHKSALTGGIHGYPDPTYLTRVQEELAQYSIQ